MNTHNTRQGEDVAGGDAHVGTLTSRAFVIERNYINFLIGGGAHAGRTCMNLIVEDKVVASATGASDNRMQAKSWDVRRWIGKTARLQIVDDERGAWGNVGVDDIVFSDKPRVAAGPLQDEADFGTLGLALLDPQPGDVATTSLADSQLPQGIFTRSPAGSDAPAVKPFGQKLAGSLTRKLTLEPGQSATVTFLVTWHFPNLKLNEKFELTGRYYAQRFKSALAVAEHLAANFDTLCQQTRLWHDTWYDSTLPYWFLDRTFANTSILATSTCFRFGNGRFWGWEGVGCCAGTCAHVWHYAHAVGRLFPELERILRERVDFGVAQRDDGAILFRGEFNNFPAVDGQAGAILRAYREHQMSADDAFLRRVWPGVKQGVGIPDPRGRQRRRADRGQAAQHAGRRLVRPRGVAQFAVPGRAAGRRADGPRNGRGSVRRAVPADLRQGPRGDRRAAVRRRVLRQPGRSRSIPKRSTPARAATSTRCSGRVGRIKWAWAACCRRRKRTPRCSRCGATTSRPTSARTARRTSPAAGTPCPAKAAC